MHPLTHAHPALTLLSELLDVSSISGHEAAIAARIRAILERAGINHETDPAGNVLVRLSGRQPDAPRVCLAAHVDEIGMVVNCIDDDGALQVIRSGGLYPWKLGEGPVEIVGDVETITGVLSMGSTHTANAGERTVTWSDVRIITGLSRAQLAAAGVRPGSPAAPIRAQRGPILFGDPADPLVAAWTFDDRMGVVALLRLLTALHEAEIQPQHPTIIAFTVGEEVGGLGAKALCQREDPEIFIAIDGSPIPPEADLKLDDRPGMWSKDRLATYDQRLLRDFATLARAAGTEVQFVAYTGNASDASLAHYAGYAPRIACFGHVRANSHGYEIARLRVFDNVLETLVEFMRNWGRVAGERSIEDAIQIAPTHE